MSRICAWDNFLVIFNQFLNEFAIRAKAFKEDLRTRYVNVLRSVITCINLETTGYPIL